MNKEDLIFYTICLLFIATIYYVFTVENFKDDKTTKIKEPTDTPMYKDNILAPKETIETNSIYKNVDISYLNPLINNEQSILQEDITLEAGSNIIVNDRNVDIDATSDNTIVNTINNNLDCDNNYEKIEGLNTCIERCPDGYIPINNNCIKRDLYEPSINNANEVTKCNRNEIEHNNECVSCPKDYTVNSDKTYCIKTTVSAAYNKSCYANSSYVKSIDKCVSIDGIHDTFVYPKTTSKECLDNQILINDKCYSCNDKDILNNEQKCVKETSQERNKKELKCPDDYIYDISNNKCIKYICPENYQYDASNNICIKFNCISGYTFDNTLKKCINDIKCNDGYIYDNGLCKKFLCEPNFTLDPVTKKCKSNNPEGECLNGTYNTETKKCELCQGRIINGKCYNNECDENNIIDDKCYVCNNGTLYKVGEEYKCITCPEGYTYDISNNICVSNDKYCNDIITTDTKCKQCPPGHIYDETLKECINEQCNNQNTLKFKNETRCYKCNGKIVVQSKGKKNTLLTHDQIKEINTSEANGRDNDKYITYCKTCDTGYYFDKTTDKCVLNN